MWSFYELFGYSYGKDSFGTYGKATYLQRNDIFDCHYKIVKLVLKLMVPKMKVDKFR